MSEKSHYLLVDGTHLAFRGFYAVKNLSRADGLPTNAIYGFICSLISLENAIDASNKVMFFDCGRSKSRIDIFDKYKANRAATPDEFKLQLPWIKKISDLLGYHVVERNGVEADDLIGSWAKVISHEEKLCAIASADKDLMQLVDDFVSQYIPSEWKKFTKLDVLKKMGVLPCQIADFLSLVGDSADNFGGINGVGPKTAANWLNTYGSLDAILNSLSSLKPERFRKVLSLSSDLLERNKKLAILQTNHFSETDSAIYCVKKEPSHEILETLRELELHSLVPRINWKLRATNSHSNVNLQQELF